MDTIQSINRWLAFIGIQMSSTLTRWWCFHSLFSVAKYGDLLLFSSEDWIEAMKPKWRNTFDQLYRRAKKRWIFPPSTAKGYILITIIILLHNKEIFTLLNMSKFHMSPSHFAASPWNKAQLNHRLSLPLSALTLVLIFFIACLKTAAYLVVNPLCNSATHSLSFYLLF